MTHAARIVSLPSETADTVLNALPHPILMVGPDGKIEKIHHTPRKIFEL